MDLKEIYALARTVCFSDFESEVRYRIDKILPTEKCDNEYLVVNKKDLLPKNIKRTIYDPDWKIIQSSPSGIQYKHKKTGETKWE